ncbi:hypothetical protein V8D89_001991 [Ganoderma adspersum]
MSSADESPAPTQKKRKIQRACDYCRGKKSLHRCLITVQERTRLSHCTTGDGSNMPDNRCSKCTKRDIECTYVMGQNNGYPRSYVEELEGRLERMEKAMNKLCSDTGINKKLSDRPADNESTHALTPASEHTHASGSRAETPLIASALTVAPPTPGSVDDGSHSDPEDEPGQELHPDTEELTEGMRKLSMHSPPLRYHGKWSGLVFIRSALALKNEFVGFQAPPKRDGQHPWLKTFVEDEFPLIEESSFPPRDLLDGLVDLYFHHMNGHWPLLHEPTFKNTVAAGQHLRNGGFGATVLLVCAIGARFTRDPRVLLDGSDHHHSAGWKWFLLVDRLRRMSFAPAKIYDVQIYALMALFLQGTTAPQSAWPVIGTGIRIALDVGAHRKKMILVLLEWLTSYGLGRPSSIHDEEPFSFDLALPTECDDEYWLTPEGEPSFKQLPGKPSKVTAFVCVLRLAQILAFAVRMIHSACKSRPQLAESGEEWEQRLVADLDSSLNQWSDSLPSHLCWDPEQENVLWLTQAASLRAFHFYTQFAVHRPFISASRRESPLSFPSVIICTNGARSSIQVLEVLYKRTGSPCHRNMGMLFMSGIILMTNIFGLKRSGRVVNYGKDLASVEKAIEMLHALRYDIHVGESLGGLLSELVSAIKAPLPPGARMPQDAQEQVTSTTEAAKAPATNRQPIPNNASAAPPSTSVTSAHLGATLQIPPGFQFLQRDAFAFALPTGLEGLGLPTEAFAVPTGGTSMQRDPLDQVPPLSAHLRTYGFLPQQDFDPTQPRFGNNPGHNFQFDMVGGQMFGLQPLGYSESMSFLPSASASASHDYAQPSHNTMGATSTEPVDQDGVDTGMPDFAPMDDALTVWSNLPPAMGLEEWGAYFADPNNVAGT